jgi:hypothetical protein
MGEKTLLPLSQPILNAFIIHSSCEGKLRHKVFRERLVGHMIHAIG